MRYDSLRPPDAEQWLDPDEMERMDLVADYHRCALINLPNPRLHAPLHAIVENQILLAERRRSRPRSKRLLAEGLDRHDAIDAIASVSSGASRAIKSRHVVI